MGAKSRRKGAASEREVVNILKAAGYHAERRAPMQAGGDADDPDIYSRELGRIEVKRRASGFSLIYAALEKHDFAIIRSDRREWLIVQPLREFIQRGRDDE